MSLQHTVRADMVEAMKAKEEVRLRVLRGLVTLFTMELTATKRTPQDVLTDDEVLALIRRSVKQRAEAASQFRAGKREDLAVNEEAEAEILKRYLPATLSIEEIQKVVDVKITELNVVDKSGMGKLIGAVMAELQGKADGKEVKEIIEKTLA